MKTVLIVGMGGIGEAIAKRFEQDGNYTVVTSDISGRVDYRIDITDIEQVEKMMRDICFTYGHLDVLVNAAGVNWMNPVKDMPVEQFQRVVDINLNANFYLLKKYEEVFGEHLSRKCFISITSDSGIIPKSNSTSYCASKAGANHFMCTAAREFAKFDKNWVIIPLALGRVAGTPMDLQTKRDMCKNMGITMEEAEASLNRNIPLKRGMRPDEVGEWTFFLAERGDYAHGCVLRIDGGQLQG